MPTQLRTAHDYFSCVLKPNYESFAGSDVTFQTVINVSSSLFHMHEWIFQNHKAKCEAVLGQKFKSKGALWQHVEQQVHNSAYFRDIANSAKHVVLTMNPSTSMTHAANTVITTPMLDRGGNLDRSFNLDSRSSVNVEAHPEVNLSTCAKELFRFWEDLVNKL